MASKKIAAKEPPAHCDVIMIGSGLGGLSCAIELALQGFHVCVFEQHRVFGGYAHNFVRRGFTFDVSLHYVGGLDQGSMAYGVLENQGVLDKLKLYRFEHLFTIELPG